MPEVRIPDKGAHNVVNRLKAITGGGAVSVVAGPFGSQRGPGVAGAANALREAPPAPPPAAAWQLGPKPRRGTPGVAPFSRAPPRWFRPAA